MNDTLKVAGRIGAELGAAKAENEKLRKALKRIIDRCEAFVDDEAEMRTPSVEVLMGIAEDAIYTVHEADVALSHQAEPTDTYTAVDMATAAAQGFRDGQAAVEQAPANDELLSGFCQWYRGKNGYAPYHPRGSEGAEAFAAGAEWQRTRPAQTEQQPVQAVHIGWDYLDDGTKVATFFVRCSGNKPPKLYAAPIAQTAPQPGQSGKFAMHQRVRKTSGSEWQGRICGTYSTALTPEGYAVESEAHAGSVQIYPAKALEAVE